MVDFGHFREERPYYRLVTERLRRGDITTHVFRGPVPFLDEHGKLLDYLYRARERGVIFDVGHGAGSFVFRNAVPSIEQGFYPDSISTDLHVLSMNEGMIDMTTLMSKFLVMGMPLGEVVRASTINPAREIGHGELGHLSVGAIADIAVLTLMEGKFGYVDAYDGRLEGDRRLFCELTSSREKEESEVLNGRERVEGTVHSVFVEEDGFSWPFDTRLSQRQYRCVRGGRRRWGHCLACCDSSGRRWRSQ